WLNLQQENIPTTCLVKLTTGVPCPACGTTRSLLSILSGHLAEALWINPLGFLAAGVLALLPFWLLWDALSGKHSAFVMYRRAEFFIQKPAIAIVLVLLVLSNWIWNIHKDL